MAEKIGVDLDALLKLHHERLAECRRRNEILVERTIAVLVILVGFLVFGNELPPGSIKCLAVLGAIAGSIGICVILYKNNHTYLENAKVIKNINHMLLLYEHKEEIKKSLYPSEWISFGDKSLVQVCLPFWVFIMGIAVIAAIAICIR